MKTDLSDIVRETRDYMGLLRKGPIKEAYQKLIQHGVRGPELPNYGDDAAIIPMNDEYLLLAADGMMTKLLQNEPYAAGKASVMVTVNDIYSMGGRPVAMVNVLASGNAAHRSKVLDGIRKGCEKLNVPMVGGHLHPDASEDAPSLSVAILGRARKVLRSHLARPGDDLLFASDLTGKPGCSSVTSWDANSGKTTDQLLYRLEALPLIAEREWARACKDVSNAGLLGTLSIMMENSGTGAIIHLDAIPCPSPLSLSQWVLSFQSFGFVLSASPEYSNRMIHLFGERGIDAAVIGTVLDDSAVNVQMGHESLKLFDFAADEITGISRSRVQGRR